MSETSEKIIDKVIDNATSRLKIPIVSTYIIVLLFHNWDLVYYLLFQSGEATTKIAYIKKHYPNYWGGIFEAVGIAICVLVVVSLLDLLLTYVLKEVYKNKKKLTDQINDYKTFEEIQTALSIQINEVVALKEKLSIETSSNINNLNIITELSNDNNNLKYSNSELTNKVELEKDYVIFGKLIEEISDLKNGTEHSTLHYFEELLNFFYNLYSESTTYFLLNEKLNPNDKIELRVVYFDMLSKLISHEYIKLGEQHLKETTNIFLSNKIFILYRYMNINNK